MDTLFDAAVGITARVFDRPKSPAVEITAAAKMALACTLNWCAYPWASALNLFKKQDNNSCASRILTRTALRKSLLIKVLRLENAIKEL